MIFTHTMPWSEVVGQEQNGVTTRVLIEADWYTAVPGEPINPRNGLRQVQFDQLWCVSAMAYLINMYAHNLAMWPSNGQRGDTERTTRFDVVHYHYFDTEE